MIFIACQMLKQVIQICNEVSSYSKATRLWQTGNSFFPVFLMHEAWSAPFARVLAFTKLIVLTRAISGKNYPLPHSRPSKPANSPSLTIIHAKSIVNSQQPAINHTKPTVKSVNFSVNHQSRLVPSLILSVRIRINCS